MSTPSVVPQDESVPPPLPAGVPAVPAGSAGPARTAWRGALPRLLWITLGVALGLLGGAGVLPLHAADFPLFWLGMILGINVHLIATRLLAPFSGLATVWTSFGSGRWLGSTVRGGRLTVFRPVPLLLFRACLVVVDRPGLRRRLWWGTVLALLAEALVASALIASGGHAASLGWGVAAIAVLRAALRPGRVTSVAWRLLRLPFGQQEQRLSEWLHDPATLAAARAAAAGRIDLVRAALDGAEPSGLPTRQAMSTVLALAEGRCADAALTAAALWERLEAPMLRRGALQLYACAIADGVAAGHWRAADAMPNFSAALAALRAEGSSAALRGTDLAAMEALFRGRPQQAGKLAASAAAMAPDALSRARALLTQSAAHTVAGRPAVSATLRSRAAALVPALRVHR